QQILGFNNYFTMGGSIDHGRTEFSSNSELGFIFPNLFIGPVPGIPGMGSIIHTLGNVGFIPVGLAATNTYYGVYATDTLDLTSALSVTGGVRLNVANIHLADELGFTPDRHGRHNYMHPTPRGGGAQERLARGGGVWGGWGKANRPRPRLAPGYSTPSRRVWTESTIGSAPPLKQVVADTFEAGFRGQLPVNGGTVEWKLGAFR